MNKLKGLSENDAAKHLLEIYKKSNGDKLDFVELACDEFDLSVYMAGVIFELLLNK